MISLQQQKKINKTIAQRIRRYSEKILSLLNLEQKDLTIILTDNNYIKNINKIYFKKDNPTNVISFPFEEENYLGEIYVSVDRAYEEAKEWGVSFFYEIMYLIIHGTLHLIGYDHTKSKEDEEKMELKEIEIVKKLNLKKWKNKNDN